MELRRLHYFIAVAETEHFRRAAEDLRIAQPILSRHIKALEDELGIQLFERLPRGVRLTHAGRSFLADARSIVASIGEAQERARRIARGELGTLRIPFTEAGSWSGVVPDTIRAFRLAYPQARLELRALDSMSQQRELQAGNIDAGFMYELGGSLPEIQSHTVQHDVVMLALPATHGLAEKPTIWLRDITDEPFVWNTRSLNPRFDNALMSRCLQQGLVPRIVQEVTNSATVLSLIAVGLGVGFVPGAMRWRLQQGVILKPVKDLRVPYRTDIAWRQDADSPLLSRFVETAIGMARPARTRRN